MRSCLPLCLCLLACGEPPVTAFSLEVTSSAPLELVPPGALTLSVRARWSGPSPEPVEVELRNLPAGTVPVPPFMLTPDAPSREVELRFFADAAAGARRVPVVAHSGGQVRWQLRNLVVRGAPGAMDRSFGTAGISRICDVQQEVTRGVVVGSTGELYVFGEAQGGLAVAILGASGAPIRGRDKAWLRRFPGFETAKVVASSPLSGTPARAVVATESESRVRVLAVDLSPLSVDSTFGELGVLETTAVARVGALAAVPGGLALVGGERGALPSRVLALRLSPFGRELPGPLRFDLADAAHATALAVDVQGRWLFAMTQVQSGLARMVLARVLPDGSGDPSLGADGVRTLDLPAQTLSVTAVLPQGDGTVLLGLRGQTSAMVARLLGDGALDPAFGTAGVVALKEATSAPVRLVARKAGGGVYAATSVRVGSADLDFAIAALNGDGSLDPAFGDGGWRTVAVSTGEDVLESFDPVGEHTLLLAGTARDAQGSCFALARVWR